MPITGFEQRLQAVQATGPVAALRGMRRGIEKESLRVTPDGKLAMTPHPVALGSALKHPYITTDFSEALLEFITPACDSIEAAIGWLDDIHAYTCDVLSRQDEKLWVASMPCVLQGDGNIPVAQYGTSYSARMKTTYRLGLGHRYGRLMQTIAGIHYNVSFPDAFWEQLQNIEGDNESLQDYKTRRYFDLIRNVRRHIGVLLLITGASPAVCPSFVRGRSHALQPFDEGGHSLYLPYATSLRMGGLGYQSNAQSALHVCYNSLDSYIRTLKQGLTQSHPAYAALGVKDANGVYQQLNSNLLQIENEFYASVRPKRVTAPGETPIVALHERGVEYLEIRCVDLNPYLPVGIDADTARVVELFLLWCLLSDSPPADDAECERIARNQVRVVERGRDPDLQLETTAAPMGLTDLYASARVQWQACADLLDQTHGGNAYRQACEQTLLARLDNPERTPSSQLLRHMRDENVSFFRLAKQLASQQTEHFIHQPLSTDQRETFQTLAARSLTEQQAAEALSVDESFDTFLARYFSQYDSV
jgi:glutamate--cysteine ligase